MLQNENYTYLVMNMEKGVFIQARAEESENS